MAERLPFIKELRYVSRHPGLRLLSAVTLLLAVSVVGFVLAMWVPSRHHHAGLLQQAELKRVEQARARQVAAVAGTAAQAAELLRDAHQRLEARVEQAEQVARLHELAARHGVTILSESNQQGERREGYATVLQEIVLAGEYVAMRRLVEEIYRFPTLTVPWDVTLTAGQGDAQVRGVLLLATYRRTGSNAEVR